MNTGTAEQKLFKSAAERHRKWLHLIMWSSIFATVLLTEPPRGGHHLNEYIHVVGYVLIILATTGTLWCGIYIFGRKTKELCQDGPYSLCRNPIYVFHFVGGLGIVMGTSRIGLIIPFVAAYCLYYYFVIESEQKRLLKFFGKEYENYCARTPRVIPRFRNYWSREITEISPHHLSLKIINSMNFLWAMVALQLLDAIKGSFRIGS